MAEVIDYWPARRPTAEVQMVYPWEHWTKMDENGHGDIWLAELGIDFPSIHTPWRFRTTLYKRAQLMTQSRKKAARKALVVAGKSVKREPVFTPVKVRVTIVSETQAAFQFYEGDEPPVTPQGKAVVPSVRRKNLHGKPVQMREKADIR